MLKRKIESTLQNWYESDYGLLIDGARQIGKTYIIHDFITKHFDNVVEINLLENKNCVMTLSKSINSDDFMLRLSSLIDKPLVKGSTVIFLDEIQEFKDFDIITMMKFLIEKKDYRFVVSGSLLGIKEYGVDSWPEGYMMLEKMYPLDFEEFLWANGVNSELINIVQNSFNELKIVPDYIHEKLIYLFKLYLLIGGMPKAVDEYVKTKDLNRVSLAHQTIERLMSKDVTKYAAQENRILIQEMYRLIPEELKSQSKRFKLSDLTLPRNENLGLTYAWFTASGIAIPTYNVKELSIPLSLNTERRLLKLFMMDVGLLNHLLMNNDIKTSLLNSEMDLNFGAIYENAVAQSLISKGYDNLYYYSKHGIGELDFLIQKGSNILPIEVKSGKDYKRHSALNNVFNNSELNKHVKKAYVLTNNNLEVSGNIIYLPIYMIMYI